MSPSVEMVITVILLCFFGGFSLAFGIWSGMQAAVEMFGGFKVNTNVTTTSIIKHERAEVPEPTL